MNQKIVAALNNITKYWDEKRWEQAIKEWCIVDDYFEVKSILEKCELRYEITENNRLFLEAENAIIKEIEQEMKEGIWLDPLPELPENSFNRFLLIEEYESLLRSVEQLDYLKKLKTNGEEIENKEIEEEEDNISRIWYKYLDWYGIPDSGNMNEEIEKLLLQIDKKKESDLKNEHE